MKLASLRDGSRDGRLVVVSPELDRYLPAKGVARSLQEALDRWAEAAPGLSALAHRLESGEEGSGFGQGSLESPLPRTFQWLDGSAFLNHVELVRRARGAAMPDGFRSDPLMYQGGSDSFLGPRDDIPVESEAFGIDFEAEVAVVVDDTPIGISTEAAAEKIELVMLVNDITFRNLTSPELAKGFGFLQSKPSSAFSPVAVTPGELGDAWSGGKLHLPVCIDVNGEPFGRANAGKDMEFDFPSLIAHAARTRRLTAGTIIGSGTVSNKLNGGPGKPVRDGGAGYSCIAELRMVETIERGAPVTPFLRYGDNVRIWVDDGNGQSVFGEINQTVRKLEKD